ncbi:MULTISPECIES: translation elongation factor Ts [Acetobacter]|uniref:Elongation factor Ts n=1 Tax=Acetobacter thailandicus TaxID=1502842 RepID=A0ABT3QGA9_9PROT|nr:MULTISPECIES: translation elongation factor Ts [Acetobacter]MBS0960556.1 elongation factor Ts [Acetobacter thailandicus]MBS0980137.1 elongation factor Ts [Acetobacter thailandicus]MBS0985983.1 elongation factor Ts [Acetobacter thailandicus]MBS1002976.1 elongation factor Ts [Acetobacter thailandicus]MCX2564324.1 translation elongation factor Ts [Acetobacter thailandicus]
MAAITAALVKELREKTGAGMMDCKKALNESNGEVEAAIDWLRTKGLAAAAKKSGRTAAEGLVGVASEDKKAAMVEVNAETDFVARNEAFQNFVESVAKVALKVGEDLEAIKAAVLDTGRTVADELTHLIATIGENMSLRRARVFTVPSGVVATYVHGALRPGLGKIGVLAALEAPSADEAVLQLGRQIGMHVAATRPSSLDVSSLNPEEVERERAVLVEQARDSGKPEAIIEKMIEGRIRKFYEEVVLLEQVWVHDGESRVKAVVEKAGVKLAGFDRFHLGEGIDKEEDDFAAEVAKVSGV